MFQFSRRTTLKATVSHLWNPIAAVSEQEASTPRVRIMACADIAVVEDRSIEIDSRRQYLKINSLDRARVSI